MRGTAHTSSEAADPAAHEVPMAEPGDLVGRYHILRRVGQGATGWVFCAYDPELDRKVALKILRRSGTSVVERRERLRREARALGRLRHPNVVGVHDVGIDGELVFIAMELIEGQTLAERIGDGPLPWREAMQIFVQAGHGLAAAHRCGLCHRDFKPSNVLIDQAGAVRVADFGLARPNAGECDPPRRDKLDLTTRQDSGTRTSKAVGTPAYMAPEVRAGKRATFRSDQFSFCITWFESLTGRLPSDGRASPLSLLPRDLPARVRRVVARGLAPDPQDRFASMDELLAAASAASQPRRLSRLWTAIVSGMSLTLMVGLALDPPKASAPPAVCTGPDAAEALETRVWNGAVRRSVRDGLLATKVPYARDTSERAITAVDAYVRDWGTHYQQACRAISSDAAARERALAQLRLVCLTDRLATVDGLARQLAHVDATSVTEAAMAAHSLPPLQSCQGAAVAAWSLNEPTAAQQVAVDATRALLLEATAHSVLGSYAEGLRIATAAVHNARATGYEPLVAEALVQQGSLQQRTGSLASANSTLTESYFVARRAQHPRMAARAAQELIGVELKRNQFEAALKWVRMAQTEIDAANLPEAERARVLELEGAVLREIGRVDDAQVAYSQSRDLTVSTLGPEHPRTASVLTGLATVLELQGRFPDAIELHRNALKIRLRVLGPAHPSLAPVLHNLAVAELRAGDLPAARQRFEDAIALKDATLPDDTSALFVSVHGLGITHRRLGELGKAEQTLERAVALAGDIPANQALALTSLAGVADDRGDIETALEMKRGALATVEEAFGQHHARTARVRGSMAETLERHGDYETALAEYRALVETYRELGQTEQPLALFAQLKVGVCLGELGRHAQARGPLTTAYRALQAQLGARHPAVAKAAAELGRLEARTGSLLRARTLLEEAEAGLGDERENGLEVSKRLIDVLLALADVDAATDAAHRLVARVGPLGASHPDSVRARDILKKVQQAAH